MEPSNISRADINIIAVLKDATALRSRSNSVKRVADAKPLQNYFVNVEVQIPAEKIFFFFFEDFFSFYFFLLLLPQLIMLHLFLIVYFVYIYNHKITRLPSYCLYLILNAFHYYCRTSEDIIKYIYFECVWFHFFHRLFFNKFISYIYSECA